MIRIIANTTAIAVYAAFFVWIAWSYYIAFGTDITAWMLG